MASVIILIAWFGTWPKWLRFFLESCRYNPTVQFALITDCPSVEDLPPNVSLHHYGFDEYQAHIAAALGLKITWTSPYKLCDLKPAYADVHPDIVEGYDFWGFGDIDVIYGNLRAIYDSHVLSHDIVSSHAHITAGHLTIIRNVPHLNRSYRRVRGWRDLLSRSEHRGFDEYQWSYQFTPNPPVVTKTGWGRAPLWHRAKRRVRSPLLKVKGHFVEQFSSSLYPLPWIDGRTSYPGYWIWREGHLTSEGAGDREFLYLHFTHWQSDRWTNGEPAAWKLLDRLDHLPPARPTAFQISAEGFKLLG